MTVIATQAGDADYNPASASQSFYVAASGPQLTYSTNTVRTASGYQLTLTVTNIGNASVTNVVATVIKLNATNGTPLPQSLGTIAAYGGSASATVNYPASIGSPGTVVKGQFNVTSTLGTTGIKASITLP